MIKFDEIEIWHPILARILYPHISTQAKDELSIHPPQYIEDARDILLAVNRDTIIDETCAWLHSSSIAGYHGTRISSLEEISIKTNGLRALCATDRRDRLNRAIRNHADQKELEIQIEEILTTPSKYNQFGHRQGQAHLTLSLGALSFGFNHYLKYGSEFDNQIMQSLLGQEGLDLLRQDGESKVITVEIPGQDALIAAHPYFSQDDMRRRGEIPNIANEFLKAFAFRFVRNAYTPIKSRFDCGMIFRKTIPPEWIYSITSFNESIFADCSDY